MCAAKYSVEEIARHTGVPVCLVNYYVQIGLIGKPVPRRESASAELELVDFDDFIQCATEARFSDEEIHCLQQLNERADAKALRLASVKMTDLIQHQRSIARLQEHLETWLSEYCFKSGNNTSGRFIK